MLDRAVHEIAVGQRRVTEPQRVRLVDHALAHLRREERDARLVDEFEQHLAGGLAVAARADHQERMARGLDRVDRMRDRLLLGHRPPAVAARNRLAVALLVRDVFRQLEVRGARALFLRAAERLAYGRRDVADRHDLPRELRERLHHVDHVDDLEVTLLAGLDRLLPGDHQHRHAAELRIRGGRHEVRRTGPERGDTHAGAARQAAVGGGHEPGRLLVPGQHELDLRSPQRFEQIEVFLAGNAEHVLDAFGFQRLHEQIRCFHGGLSVDAACPAYGHAAFRTRAGLRHADALPTGHEPRHCPPRNPQCTAAPPETGGQTDPRARGKHARAAKTFLIVDGFGRSRLRPNGHSAHKRSARPYRSGIDIQPIQHVNHG